MILPFVPLASVNPDLLKLHIEDVMWAANHCGVHSEEKLALVLEIDKAQLHRQMKGEGHFSLTRLVAAFADTPQFWAHLGWRLCVRFGLPTEARRAAHLALALVGRKRQARMLAVRVPQKRSA